MFEKIERWYCFGLWNEEMVMSAVDKGILTPDEAARILGK